MGKVTLKLNSDGVRQLLRSQEMMSVCAQYASRIQQRCGDGYATSQHKGENRVNVSVYAESYEAMADCRKNNTLLKAVKG